jgi:hypothetical protein
MRHRRRTVLATFAIALCAAPAASAHDRHQDGGGAVVAPARGGGLTGGELLAKGWSVGPFATEDPFSGSCVTLARNVIAPHFGDDGTATCAATQRTRLFVYFGTACFNVEEGGGETEEEQLACAVAADQAIQQFNVKVDDGKTVRLVRRRFELVSRQTTVPVPPGSGYDSVTATFTAHAWGAVIRRLRPGRHTVALEVVADFGTFPVTVALDVARGGHPDDEDADSHDHDHD